MTNVGTNVEYEFAILLDNNRKPAPHFLTRPLYDKIINSEYFTKNKEQIKKEYDDDIKKMVRNKKILKYYVEPSFLKDLTKKSRSRRSSVFPIKNKNSRKNSRKKSRKPHTKKKKKKTIKLN